MKKVTPLKNAISFFTVLFIVWGLYRLLFKLPDEVEELIIKPLVWVVPVIFLVRRERATLESIGLTLKNLFPAIYMSLALGSVFVVEAVILNFLKYGKLNFGANLGSQTLMVSLVTSFATAFSEELVFRGYIFTRLWGALNNEWTANLITSILWTLIHVPITILVNKLAPVDAIVYLFLTFVFGMGSAFIYGRTKNIGSSIFLHVLWEWPIMLFR
ncbi:MAG TPA: CPBP family intramembrane glutamic endopeptidase [Candidatus Saccharimonadales bacterium]|nr:CPBP family intramembrane glutamic endopeptidase [Candidatus Saccharimonadales bacterium]